MCEPTTIALGALALSAGSTITSFIGQNQQAKANTEAAEDNYRQQHVQEQLAQAETREKATQELQRASIDAAQARGEAIATAGAAGVSGLSVSALLADYDRQSGVIHENIRRSQEFSRRNSIQRTKAFHSAAVSQANQVPFASPLAAGLQIAGGAVDAGSTYLRLKSIK